MRLLPGHPTSRNHPAPLAALALRQKLEAVGRAVRERAVDAVLFLDRLDSYKVDTLDRKVGTCSCLVVRWRCAGTALGGGVCSTGGIHGCLWGVRCGRCYPHHDTPAHQRTHGPWPQVVEGVSRVLGPRIWDNVVLGFTRASESSAPAGAQLQACSLPGGMAGFPEWHAAWHRQCWLGEGDRVAGCQGRYLGSVVALGWLVWCFTPPLM